MAKRDPAALSERTKKIIRGDPTLWRLPLAQAVIDLLEKGEALTPASLLKQLRTEEHENEIELRGLGLEAAIERLQKFVVAEDQ